MAGALLVAGIGGGLVISPNQTLTLADIPVEDGGVAGSMAQLGQRIGTSVGTAAATSVFFAAIMTDSGNVTPLEAYHHGFRDGVLVAIALIVVALAVAVTDQISRRRHRDDPAAAAGADRVTRVDDTAGDRESSPRA
jgi:MFS family permease